MSRWPTSAAALRAQVVATRTGVTRAWAGVRGRLPRHVAYLHAQGVASWPAGGGAAEHADSFAAWCAAHAGADVRLRIAGEFVHGVAVDAGLQLRDARAVRQYALQQLTHYHGPQAAAWPLAAWADGAQCGACGLHGVDLAAMCVEAAAHGVRVLAATPAWSTALATVAAAVPELRGAGRRALLLVEGSAATWLVVTDGRLVTLRQRFLDAPQADAVARLLATLATEGEPLAGLPVVAGWGLAAPAALPADIAMVFGALDGPGAMADCLRDSPEQRA